MGLLPEVYEEVRKSPLLKQRLGFAVWGQLSADWHPHPMLCFCFPALQPFALPLVSSWSQGGQRDSITSVRRHRRSFEFPVPNRAVNCDARLALALHMYDARPVQLHREGEPRVPAHRL